MYACMQLVHMLWLVSYLAVWLLMSRGCLVALLRKSINQPAMYALPTAGAAQMEVAAVLQLASVGW